MVEAVRICVNQQRAGGQTALFLENIYDEFGKSAEFSVSDGIDLHENAQFTEAVQWWLRGEADMQSAGTGD